MENGRQVQDKHLQLDKVFKMIKARGIGNSTSGKADGQVEANPKKMIVNSEQELKRTRMLRRKIQKLKQQINYQENIYEKERIPMTLECGYIFTKTYDKLESGASGPIQGIIYNKNTRCFVTYTQKEIHVWTSEEARVMFIVKFFDETNSHQISCMTYSKAHWAYFAVSTDFKMHLFNDYLNYLGWFPLRTRLVSFLEFQEDKSTFITAGIDGCYIYSFVSKSKYEPKQALMLDPEGEAFDAEIVLKQSLESMPLWIKGLKIIQTNDCIFSWSQMKATFHNMNGKLIYKYKNLTKYEDHITDVLLNTIYKYFITATQQGNLFVWKYQKQKELVHQFDGHLKAVTSLQNVQGQPNAFISASIDNSIRIHSLDSFQELYCFKLNAGVTYVKLLDHKRFACVYNYGTVRLGELQHRAKLFHQSSNQVIKIMKCFRNEDERYANHADLVMIQYKDNSINIQTADLEESKIISIIYPPPTAKDIKFFDYCMNLDRIYLMLVTGTICVYKFDRNKVQEPAQLQQLVETKSIKDSMRRPLSVEVATMSFCKSIPPMIDEETINRSIVTDQKIAEEIEYQKTKWQEGLVDRFIVLGMSTGTVVFLQVD